MTFQPLAEAFRTQQDVARELHRLRRSVDDNTAIV